MRPPLRLLLPAALAVFCLLLIGVDALHSFTRLHPQLLATSRVHATTLGYVMVPGIERALLEDDLARVNGQLRRLTLAPQVTLALVCLGDGRIVSSTDASFEGQFIWETAAAPAWPLLAESMSAQRSRSEAAAGGHEMGATFPLRIRSENPSTIYPTGTAVLYLRFDLRDVAATTVNALWQRVLLNGSLTILGCFLLWLYLRGFLTQPLRELIAGVANYDMRGAPAMVAERGLPEVSDITRAINQLMSRLHSDQQALQASEEKFAKVFRTAPVLMTLSDPNTGTLTDVNDATLQLSGLPRHEVLGKSAVELGWLSAEDQQRILGAAQESGYIKEADLTVRAKDGSAFELLFSGERVTVNGCAQFLFIAQDITRSKRVAAEVAQSEQRFRRLFNNAGDALFVHDSQGRIVDVNDAACHSLGYSRVELLDRTVTDIDVGTSAAQLAQIWTDMSDGHAVTVLSAHRHRDGTVFPVEVRVVQFSGGEKPTFLAAVRNVRDRVRAEAAIRAGQATLQAALSSIADPVFISDTAGNYTHFNDAFVRFMRFTSRIECLTRLNDYASLVEVTAADGTPIPVDGWAIPRALRGETAQGQEWCLRRKDTGESWVGSFSFAPVRDSAGTITGAVVVGRDITAAKAAQAALAESELRFRRLFDNAADGLFVHDLSGAILDVNRAACEALGYSYDELTRLHIADIETAVDVSALPPLWERVLQGERASLRGLARRKDGTAFPVEVSIGRFLGGQRAPDHGSRTRHHGARKGRIHLAPAGGSTGGRRQRCRRHGPSGHHRVGQSGFHPFQRLGAGRGRRQDTWNPPVR